jgi:hypothetical protein
MTKHRRPGKRRKIAWCVVLVAFLAGIANIRQCARLYTLQMLVAIEQGQSFSYVNAFSRGMALAGSLRQMPTPLSQLVRTACFGLFTVTRLAGGGL